LRFGRRLRVPKFTAIVIGAGLAGMSAAYSLAKSGIDVMVVERGEYPGAKNVTGGRLYIAPIRDLYTELWAEAPFERHVVKENVTMVSDGSSTSVELSSAKFDEEPYHSFTVLRGKFDRWFAEKVTAAKARILSKFMVDDLVIEDGKVAGILVGGKDRIDADVVIAADGAMSRIAEKAHLWEGKRKPADYALGIKEVIELPSEAIDDRFNLVDGQGAARLFIGSLTRGMFGAGFIYTNQDSLSVGMVLRIKDIAELEPKAMPYELLEEFETHPEVAPLLKGGEHVEYSAHVISESGFNSMPRLYGDGILAVGDAAGMALNMGITVRGMEFAIASGAMAAEAVKAAKEKNDFSAAALSKYADLVKDSFVWKDLHTFRHAPTVLDNQRLFSQYPDVFCKLAESLFTIDESPKAGLFSTALGQLKGRVLSMIADGVKLRRI
jgi:electron transfer flavoprotein-quinone oxidoreductase